MSKMLDKIRQSAVPAAVMRSAARGSLSLPASEMLEILVELSTHKLFGDQARLTLAGWDESSAYDVLSSRTTPAAVLAYFLNPQNWRTSLLPALIDNRAVTEDLLADFAAKATPDAAAILLSNPRAHSQLVLSSLVENQRLAGTEQCAAARKLLEAQGVSVQESHDIVEKYLAEHADEIASAPNKQFELVKVDDGEHDELAELVAASPSTQSQGSQAAAGARAATGVSGELQRISVIQKIARMTVGERVQLAMKGSKDERFVLIRDSSKVVALAVLESPKLGETEMEAIAAMKNVQESVLRAIPMKRKFMKQYAVIRALVNNPKCPLDITLPLLPHLLALDLQHLTKNKNVSETIRKLAVRLLVEKTTTRKS